MKDLEPILNSIEELQKRNLQMFKAASQAAMISNIIPKEMLNVAIKAEELGQQIKTIVDEDLLQKVFDGFSTLTIDLPLPKIDFLDFDEQRLERIIRHNVSVGWTLTGEMPTDLYLRDEYLKMKHDEIDQIFISFYEQNEYQQLKSLINTLKDGLSERWSEIFDHSLDLYLEGKFKIAIPALISIIEGELSMILGTQSIGTQLMKQFKSKLDDKLKILTIATYSAYYFLDEHLFKSHKFSDSRLPLLNRNWILHGRDDPSAWKKEDALKLLNTLSTLQFIKEVEIT
ncbi:hypothetical protein MOD78_02290 [Bacillus haynesii]|uniref:hypothetical protein n=1 Tax=Bacillus haynesii TaxID=1925021 RepID=UPI00227DF4CD|nr:hypothetical protein [Bacillus haynesii]MCY8410597.1 hypothetical protein [Bacillus haynesii]MCY8432533.1 hypothetical protein [Bacillus haynesii]MCY8624439.1 hypothetical protein [Bacillus haynesii]MCY8737731.1 hypothetical protein [Bacillus haynesii]MEC0714472.1 hypothetical protein [Bacillus haynesii]